MGRRWISTALLILGVALLAVSLGQYGYMILRQHQLRRRWQRINSPIAAQAAPTRAADAAPLRLIIPSIQLDDVVVRGTSYEDLLVAPGLVEGSPLPGRGNTVIAGHRDTFFRHVADLRAGDAIEVQSGGEQFEYTVTGREIVKPSETSVLDNSAAPRLTLVTCYPTYWIGPAPDRLIVQAKLAPSQAVP
ncbi:MAG TPA: class D sortase [Terriglobales bacterium]|nr:class D sortase [Terriglobales bacterium]